MKRAFDKISAGMDDAITFAKGDESRGRIVRPVGKGDPRADAQTVEKPITLPDPLS